MLSRILCTLLLLLQLLWLTACTTVAAPWTLSWSPSKRSLYSNPPQAAYQASAYAQRPDGALLPPALTHWLASGVRPGLGLALSQLDPPGQFFAAGVVTVDPGSLWWTLTDTLAVTRPAPGAGVPAVQAAGRAWRLPPGTYNSAAVDVPDTPPGGSVQLWVSDRGQVFVLARLYASLQSPADATGVTLAGQPGWRASQGDLTTIALVLVSGAYRGLGTLLFASNVGLRQSELLATRAVMDLNDLLPA